MKAVVSRPKSGIRRAVLLSAVVGLLVLSSFPVGAQGGRTVTGAVGITTTSSYGIPGGEDHARCAWLLLGEQSQGKIGHLVALTPSEADGLHSFRLRVDPVVSTSVTYGYASVIFYEDLGSCPGSASVRRSWTFYQSIQEIIPAGSRYALIVPRFDYRPLNINYCLFPWCIPFWFVPSWTGSPSSHTFTLEIS